MSLDVWAPLESVDDALLSLESAALLSIAAGPRYVKIRSAAAQWQAARLLPSNEPAASRDMTNRLQALLEATGLRLPSAVAASNRQPYDVALSEMISVVESPKSRPNRPQAALALLNLALDASTELRLGAAALLRNEVLNKSWDCIVNFVSLLNERRKPGPFLVPNLLALNEWTPHEEELLGDHQPWSEGIGPMYQTLSGWDTTWLMSRGAYEDGLWDNIRYWTPLPHLVLGHLGWSDPALGVARWILLGMPDSTPQLSLLRRVWGTDALMYFAHPQMDWIPQHHDYLGYDLRTSGRHISEIYEVLGRDKELSDCGSLHMQVHLQWQLSGSDQNSVDGRVYNESSGRCPKFVVALERMTGWHSQLLSVGDDLHAEFPDSELELMLVAPPVGTLGTFKRSRATGVWYSGSHEAHLWGHRDLDGPLRRFQASELSMAVSSARTLSRRHTNAMAFWLASELARRHPTYSLHADGREGLQLVGGSAPTIHISRRAAIHVAGIELLGAADLFAVEDKRLLVTEIEARVGLPPRARAAATTERTLLYRTMAYIIALTVGDKAGWDFVPADAEITAGAWHLTRDGQPVALLTSDGYARLSDRRVKLLERYYSHSRRMTPMIGEVFGAVLP